LELATAILCCEEFDHSDRFVAFPTKPGPNKTKRAAERELAAHSMRLVGRDSIEKGCRFAMFLKRVVVFWLIFSLNFQTINDVIPPYVPATFSPFTLLFDFEEIVHGILFRDIRARSEKKKRARQPMRPNLALLE
jgi:hypothetical protein